jgi:hypothetical protein
VVAHPQGAIDKPSSDSHDLHIGIVVADIIADLLKTTQSWKVGYRVSEHDFATQCHSHCNPGHVLLSHSRIHIPLRETLGKRFHNAETKVTSDQHDPIIFLGCL